MIATGSGWLTGARILQTGIAVLGMALLARLLSPQEFGVLAISNVPILLLVAITNGFIDVPTVREDELSGQHLRSLIWASLLITAVFSVGIWFIAPLAQAWLGGTDLAAVMRGRIPFAFVYVISAAGAAVLRRAHRFQAVSTLQIVNISTYIVLTSAMALGGLGVWSLVLGHLASISITATLAVWMVRIPLAPPRRFGLDGLAWPALTGATTRALHWGWSNIDVLAVSAALGPAITGLYNRANNVNHHLKEPFVAMDSTLRQALAVLNQRGGGFAGQVDQALRVVVIIAAVAAAAVAAARHEIVAVLLGAQWDGVAPILAVLVLALPARAALILLDGLAASVAGLGSMMARNLVLLGLVGTGAVIAAPSGATAVAAAVSLSLYIAVFLPLGAAARGTTLIRMALAAAPGVLIGLALFAGAEALTSQVPPEDLWLRVAILIGYFGITGMALGLFIPDTWLGGPLSRLRKAVLGRLRAKPQDRP